jgi:hypothetical protein
MYQSRRTLFVSALLTVLCAVTPTRSQEFRFSKGLDIRKTGLLPRYSANLSCSPLTSFYASWDDVDGSRRDEAHSGVDGGRLGDPIFAPAAATIKAAWKANWGWGEEGALLLRHTKQDLGLSDGPDYYYSEFDHLNYDEVRDVSEGSPVTRGEQLATVFRPGGKKRYLPEVHWEVWQIDNDSATTWSTNKYKGRFWLNKTGHLLDPLYLLSQNRTPSEDGSVDIRSLDEAGDLTGFKGFTYILPCRPK